MKRIFTFLIATMLLGTAIAQQGHKGKHGGTKANDIYVPAKQVYENDRNDRFDKYDHRGSYVFTPRERDMEIYQINREFDQKMYTVRNRFNASRFQKKRMLHQLEDQRDYEISLVHQKFNHPRNKFGDFNKRDRKRW